MVDSQHKSPVKRRRMQSSSDTIQQEVRKKEENRRDIVNNNYLLINNKTALRLETFTQIIHFFHPQFMDLRTRYTALVTLMTQYVKFASENLKRAEEDEVGFSYYCVFYLSYIICV